MSNDGKLPLSHSSARLQQDLHALHLQEQQAVREGAAAMAEPYGLTYAVTKGYREGMRHNNCTGLQVLVRCLA